MNPSTSVNKCLYSRQNAQCTLYEGKLLPYRRAKGVHREEVINGQFQEGQTQCYRSLGQSIAVAVDMLTNHFDP